MNKIKRIITGVLAALVAGLTAVLFFFIQSKRIKNLQEENKLRKRKEKAVEITKEMDKNIEEIKEKKDERNEAIKEGKSADVIDSIIANNNKRMHNP